MGHPLKRTLLEESLIVALVCVIFLLHLRSALVAILMLPVGILMAFIAMRLLGMSSNLMSLGGIAIAIGAMIDAAIVMIENAHKHLERLPKQHTTGERFDAMLVACKEVGPALFFSLLIITVSFLPVFSLEGQEGRLFSPLAYTKTFAMASAALLSVTLVADHSFCIGGAGCVVLPRIQTGLGVYAHAQRRRIALHSSIAARHVHHQSSRVASNARQNHQKLS